MKKLLYCLVWTVALLASAQALHAQKIQVVDSDGMPIAYVCVTNENGVLVGNTDVEGILADAKGTPVLYLSHIAFQDKAVNLGDIVDGRIVMEEIDFSLPDVEVKPKELAYTQTYYRLIYFDEEGPIYFRGGVIDNTYEFANKKVNSKKRSLAKGKSGLIRFLISTIVGRYIDDMGKVEEKSLYNKVIEREKAGKLIISDEKDGRRTVSDSICVLGYIDTDMNRLERTTSFNGWLYQDHIKEAEARAKGKKLKEKDKVANDEESFFEVYRIDEEGRSRIDDFVMRQLYVSGAHSRSEGNYVILMQAYTTKRDYIDKKEFKQTRNENKVEMNILEFKQFEQANGIPPMAPNIQTQVDKLFEKELNKK